MKFAALFPPCGLRYGDLRDCELTAIEQSREPLSVRLARLVLIVAAILMLLPYGLWLLAGMVADRRERRRIRRR